MSTSDPNALILVAAAVAALVWRYRTRDQRPVPPGTVGEGVELRPLDFVLAACDHLDHHPGHAPTSPIRYRHAGMDVRDMHLNGWGSTPHMNLCQIHNQGRRHLDSVQVRCARGCGTRGELPAGDAAVGIGGLRNRGWCNDGDLPVCPYCAGTRSRRWR